MVMPARTDKTALTDREIHEARSRASNTFATALWMSLPIGGFLLAVPMYAGMLGHALRNGRRPIVTFPVTALFCVLHMGAMAGTLIGAFLSGQGGVSPFLASGAGMVIALVFLGAIHPRLDWLDV